MRMSVVRCQLCDVSCAMSVVRCQLRCAAVSLCSQSVVLLPCPSQLLRWLPQRSRSTSRSSRSRSQAPSGARRLRRPTAHRLAACRVAASGWCFTAPKRHSVELKRWVNKWWVSNFPQFSAIFFDFPQFSAIFCDFPRLLIKSRKIINPPFTNPPFCQPPGTIVGRPEDPHLPGMVRRRMVQLVLRGGEDTVPAYGWGFQYLVHPCPPPPRSICQDVGGQQAQRTHGFTGTRPGPHVMLHVCMCSHAHHYVCASLCL